MATRPLENSVRAHRERLGLSQQQLANRAGVTRHAILAIESGRRVPSTTLALRLGRALGCGVEELFQLTPTAGVSARIASGPEGRRHASGRGDRVALGRIGGRLVAHPLAFDATVGADGVLLSAHPDQTGLVRPFGELGLLDRSVLVAGCAPLLGALAQRVHARFADARLTWLNASSGRALELLGAGLVHAAGVHLSNAVTGEDNAAIVRRTFPGRPMLILNLTRWRQGFVVPEGNPLDVRAPEDLLRAGIRLARREPGAGATKVLERLLSAVGAASAALSGPQAGGHGEVAQLVRSGAADVGVAIESVALEAGLTFLPLVEERFDLVLPAESADAPPVSRLVDALVGDPTFRTELDHLPGYDGSISGQITTVGAA